MQRGTEQRAQTPSPQLSSADGPLLGQDGQVLAGPQVDWHRTPQEQAELRDASQELMGWRKPDTQAWRLTLSESHAR